MPHKCLDCKNLIESGTIDIQKGCPICGGKKFQYIRPRPQPEERKQTVSEYVAHAALREPQLEAKEAPISRIPGRKPKEASKGTPEEAPTSYVRADAAHVRPAEHRPPPIKPKPRREEEKGERIESVRIIEDGAYDINLPLLLSRKEFVMSREEGSYTLDLNSAMKPEKKKHKGRKGK